MKNLIGKEVTFILEGLSDPIKGIVVKDLSDRVLMKGKDEKITRIIKSKIVLFQPTEEPDENKNKVFHVLACQNTEKHCSGVRHVISGKPGESDYEDFMNPCPAREGGCEKGCLGELSQVSERVLFDMFEGTVFGDYPNGN